MLESLRGVGKTAAAEREAKPSQAKPSQADVGQARSRLGSTLCSNDRTNERTLDPSIHPCLRRFIHPTTTTTATTTTHVHHHPSIALHALCSILCEWVCECVQAEDIGVALLCSTLKRGGKKPPPSSIDNRPTNDDDDDVRRFHSI